jgi:hypothetical protein
MKGPSVVLGEEGIITEVFADILSDISDKELTIVVRFEAFMVVKIQVEVF